MKLKFLMMPAVIIISIILIIWFIWPTWFDDSSSDSIVSIKKEINVTQNEINKIKQKKTNIASLDQSLQDNSEDKDLITKYYPTTHREEDIMNKINHIAFSSGVYIDDLSVEYGKKTEKEKINKILEIPKNVVKISTVKSKTIASNKIIPQGPGLVSFQLKIYGNYDQIKKFLNALYPIGLLSNIQSFGIEKEDNKEEGGDDNAEDTSTLLTGKITVNFGYLKQRSSEIANLLEAPLFATNSFNFANIDEYKSLLLEKYPNSEVGETGESNPFFP